MRLILEVFLARVTEMRAAQKAAIEQPSAENSSIARACEEMVDRSIRTIRENFSYELSN